MLTEEQKKENKRKSNKKYRESEKGKKNYMRYLLKKKKERIKIKLLAFAFQMLNAGYKIKVIKIIDYSINGYLYKMRLANE